MPQHPIQHFDPSTRSLIYDSIFRVLAQYVNDRNFGPLRTAQLFLQAADILADGGSGIVKRPDNVNRFVDLDAFNVTVSFPNYGVNQNIANLMREVIWELYVQMILAPVPDYGIIVNDMKQDVHHKLQGGLFFAFNTFLITSFGAEVLSDSTNRTRVYDPDGYLANFSDSEADLEMMRYLEEGVSVFRGGHLLASVVLLGAASERLVEMLAQKLSVAIVNSGGTEWYEKKYEKERNISKRFKVVGDALMGHYGERLKDENLRDEFEGAVKLTFEQIKNARNKIAHPKGYQFSWNEVNGLYHNFVPYFKHISRIIDLLKNSPIS